MANMPKAVQKTREILSDWTATTEFALGKTFQK